MKPSALKSMSIEDVIELKLQIDSFLNEYVRREQQELDRRLKQLSALTGSSGLLSKDAGLLSRLAETGLAKPRLAAIQKALKGFDVGKAVRPGADGRSFVQPKYRNPDKPSETWSGRGKRPRWLQAAMKATGKGLTYFEIGAAGAKARRPRK